MRSINATIFFPLPCGYDGVFRPEAVNGTVFHAQGYDSYTLPLVHQQVQGEILHEVAGVVPQRLAEHSERTELKPCTDSAEPRSE